MINSGKLLFALLYNQIKKNVLLMRKGNILQSLQFLEEILLQSFLLIPGSNIGSPNICNSQTSESCNNRPRKMKNPRYVDIVISSKRKFDEITNVRICTQNKGNKILKYLKCKDLCRKSLRLDYQVPSIVR